MEELKSEENKAIDAIKLNSKSVAYPGGGRGGGRPPLGVGLEKNLRGLK